MQDFEQNKVADDDLFVVLNIAKAPHGFGVAIAEISDPNGTIDDNHRFEIGGEPDRMSFRSPSHPSLAISAIACFYY